MIDVLVVVYTKILLVSTSVTFTVYKDMMPFCDSTGGGSHDTWIDVELIEETVTLSGESSGAAKDIILAIE